MSAEHTTAPASEDFITVRFDVEQEATESASTPAQAVGDLAIGQFVEQLSFTLDNHPTLFQ